MSVAVRVIGDGEQSVTETRTVVTDKPKIDLVAIENFRISPRQTGLTQ